MVPSFSGYGFFFLKDLMVLILRKDDWNLRMTFLFFLSYLFIERMDNWQNWRFFLSLFLSRRP